MKKLNTKFKIFRVVIIVRNHYFIILKLFRVIKRFILFQRKIPHQNRITTSQLMTSSRTPAEMKNCKLKTPLLFGPLAQYLGSEKQRVLSPCVTYVKKK